jgi:hypothetical protein
MWKKVNLADPKKSGGGGWSMLPNSGRKVKKRKKFFCLTIWHHNILTSEKNC